jgi:hypothetical protein
MPDISTADVIKSITVESLQSRKKTLGHEALFWAINGDMIQSESLRQRAIQMDRVISMIDPGLSCGVNSIERVLAER